MMTTGAAYGNGIYLALDSGTSIGYAKAQAGWAKSLLVDGGSPYQGIQCLALCEGKLIISISPHIQISNLLI